MLLVGLSMPYLMDSTAPLLEGGAHVRRLTASQPPFSWGLVFQHALAMTVLSNLGKMGVSLFYRREASRRERLALGIGMWPRGEVGGGVLVMPMGYGLGGPVMAASVLCLVINLLLTGVFIVAVKRLMGVQNAKCKVQREQPAERVAS